MTSADAAFTENLTVKRFENGRFDNHNEKIVAERLINLFVNGDEAVRLMALPDLIEELATGFLYSECIISRREDIVSVSFNPTAMSVEVQLTANIQPVFNDKVRSITSACGRGLTFVSALNASFFRPVTTNIAVLSQTVIDLMRKLQRNSSLFQDTGGVHSAAIARGDEMLFSCDDIGRHNAVDKALGWLIRSGQLSYETENTAILLTTGRLASEMVTKAVRGRFSVMISPSAPTSGAVQLAEDLGITLIGFTRGGRFNVYTHPERVTL